MVLAGLPEAPAVLGALAAATAALAIAVDSAVVDSMAAEEDFMVADSAAVGSMAAEGDSAEEDSMAVVGVASTAEAADIAN